MIELKILEEKMADAMRTFETGATRSAVEGKPDEIPRDMRVLDLCCGRGGWSRGFVAAGWKVFGIDIEPQPTYPGFPKTFAQGDVRLMSGLFLRGVFNLIVASLPYLGIIEAVRRIARDADTPLIIESVRGAQKWLGKAPYRFRSTYLWGDLPTLMPALTPRHRQKQSFSSSRRDLRAEVPFELAYAVAQRVAISEQTRQVALQLLLPCAHPVAQRAVSEQTRQVNPKVTLSFEQWIARRTAPYVKGMI